MDDYDPPSGFVEDVAPPDGFQEDAPISAGDATAQSKTAGGVVSPVIEASPADPNDLEGFYANIKQSGKGLAQVADVVRSGSVIAGVKRAEQTLADAPSEFSKYIRGSSAERAVDVIEMAGETAKASRERIVGREKEIQALGQQLSPEMKAFNAAEGGDALGIFLRNPVEVTANIIGSSLVSSVPSIALGAAGSLGGPAGTAAGVGAGSFAVEYANKLVEELRKEADLTDPNAFAAVLSDTEKMSGIREKAVARGVPVAVFDAATAGLAGRFLKPALGTGMKPVLKATGKEIAQQSAGGGVGEVSGSLAAGDPVSAKNVAIEMLAEVAGSPGEVIGNIASSRAPAPLDPIAPETARAVESTKPTPEEKPIVNAPSPEPSPTEISKEPSAPTGPAQSQDAAAAKSVNALAREGVVSPHDFAPALVINGETVRGRVGETHKDVFNRYLAENAADDAKVDAALEAFPKDETHIFTDKAGKELDREQVGAALGGQGRIQSERLQELQKEQPNPVLTENVKAPEAAPADAPVAAKPTATPKLLPGQKQGDLLGGSEDLTLVGEKAVEKPAAPAASQPTVQETVNEALRAYGRVEDAYSSLGKQIEALKADPKQKAVVTRLRAAQRHIENSMRDEARREESALHEELLTGQHELVQSVKDLGGLPSLSALGKYATGELKVLLEASKGAWALFRNNAKSLDTLREALADRGFQFETPFEMIEAITESLATGKKKHGSQFPEGYRGGPGAMGPVEGGELAGEGATTSLKRAVVDAERKAKLLEEIPTPNRLHQEDVVRIAEDAVDVDSTLAPGLVARIVDGGSRAISEHDAAVLLIERARLMNERKAVETAEIRAGTQEEQFAAQTRLEEIEVAQERLDRAQRSAGSSWSDVGRMYQRLIRDDFTLEAIERKYRKAAERPLSAGERETIAKQAKEIEELQGSVAEKQAAVDEVVRQAEVIRGIEATMKELQTAEAARPKWGKEVFEVARGVVDRWSKEADDSMAEIRRMFGSEAGGVGGVGGGPGGRKMGDASAHNAALITHLARVIRGKIGKFGLNAAETFASLAVELPQLTRETMQKAWVKAQGLIDAEKAPPKVKQAIKEGVVKPVKGEKLPAEIKARAKAEATAGMELSHKTAYEAVRAVINSGVKGEKDIMAGAHELLKESYPELTSGELDVAFSEYGKRKYPSKEADKVELAKLRELRRMQAAIDDLMARGQSEKSGLQRAKTDAEVRKRQSELRQAIEKYGNKAEPTPEQLATREQAKLRGARNAIEDLDRELQTGEAKIKSTPQMPSSELEQLQSELAAMRELKQEILDAENPPATPAQKQVDALAKIRDRLADTLSGKRPKTAAKDWNPLSDAAADIKAEIIAMQELAAQMKRDAKPPGDPGAKAEAAQIKALEKAIETYRQKVTGEFVAQDKKLGPDSARVAALKAIRDSRADAYAAAQKAGKPVRSETEIYNATRLKGIERQMKEAEARIKEGKFAPKPKPVPKHLESATLDALAALEKKKNEVRRGEEQYRLAQRTKMTKIWDGIKQTARARTNIFSSFDVSAPRQAFGYILSASSRLLTNPKVGYRMLKTPFADMYQAAKSEKMAARIDEQIKGRINRTNGVDKISDVQFQDLHNTSFTKGEENAHSVLDDWAEAKFNRGNKAATAALAVPLAAVKGVRVSNRAFITFLNSARAQMLDELLAANFKHRAPTNAEIKAAGDVVNLATGRGNIKPGVRSALAYTPLWSPNLLVSRLQALTLQPLYKGTMKSRLIVAEEYARVIGMGWLLLQLTRLFTPDDKEEKSPLSSDYGKVVRPGKGGDTRLDPWGGFQQQTVLASRMAQAKTKALGGKEKDLNSFGLILTGAKFLRSKLDPNSKVVADIILRENWKGQKTTPGSVARDLVPIPLALGELKQLIKAHGLPEAAVYQAMQEFGIGVTNYADDEKGFKPSRQ